MLAQQITARTGHKIKRRTRAVCNVHYLGKPRPRPKLLVSQCTKAGFDVVGSPHLPGRRSTFSDHHERCPISWVRLMRFALVY